LDSLNFGIMIDFTSYGIPQDTVTTPSSLEGRAPPLGLLFLVLFHFAAVAAPVVLFVVASFFPCDVCDVRGDASCR